MTHLVTRGLYGSNWDSRDAVCDGRSYRLSTLPGCLETGPAALWDYDLYLADMLRQSNHTMVNFGLDDAVTDWGRCEAIEDSDQEDGRAQREWTYSSKTNGDHSTSLQRNCLRACSLLPSRSWWSRKTFLCHAFHADARVNGMTVLFVIGGNFAQTLPMVCK
jgi:hypothetical protein